MGSGIDETALEPLSSLNARQYDTGFDESLITNQSALRSTTPPRQSSPSKAVLKSPPKNGIPPKRLSLAAKRSVPSSASAPSKSVPSLSHGAPGTGLSKPPTRPLGSSAVRRPANSVTAATAASTGHKKKLSMSSNEISSFRRGDHGGAEENMRPTANKFEARRSVHDKGDLKNITQTLPADKLNLVSKAEQSVASSRVNSASPTKSALRSTTNGSRPISLNATPRSNRPMASSLGGHTKAEVAMKRLSTIPASPAPARLDTGRSEPSEALEPAKARRPALHSRKSTMSITIEQRLREMELVHDMLHVAMAEDGADNDAVKEEYGRKADESLATLRLRLAEARQNEGVLPQESEASRAPSEHGSGAETKLTTSSRSKLMEALHESEDKVATMSDEISDLQRRLQQATSGETDAGELSSQQGNSIITPEHLQEKIQIVRDAQTLKMDEISKCHQDELAAARAERVEAKERYEEELAQANHHHTEALNLAVSMCSAKAAMKLESEVKAYTVKLETLARDLAAEKENSAVAASISDESRLEGSKLETLLVEQLQLLSDTERKLGQHADLLREKEDVIAGSKRDIVDLQRELRELQVNKAQQLKDIETVSLSKYNALESKLSAVQDELFQLELSHGNVISSHGSELVGKDEEIHELALVIEEFQAQVQDLHEQKEREVDETKLDLIEEHEKIISDLHKKSQEDAAALTRSNEKTLQALRKEHEDALKIVKANCADDLERIEKLLGITEEGKESAEHAVVESNLKIKALEAQVAGLESEKNQLKAGRSLLDDAFKHALNEISGLGETLETLEDDTEDSGKRHAACIGKLVDRLASTTKIFEESSTKMELTIQSHTEEIERLNAIHSVNIKEMGLEKQEAFLELKRDYDTLLARLNQTEKQHGEELGTLKSEHAETFQKHARDFANLQVTQAKETQDQLDQTQKMYQGEIHALVKSHDQKCNSLREQLKLADEELQQCKHLPTGPTQDERCEKLAKEGQDFKSEIEKSRIELVEANKEIAKLSSEVEEVRRTLQDSTESDHLRYEMYELTQQHAAEVSRIQDEAALETEKRAKERKQGAEVRDRLVGETEKLTNDLAAARSEVEKCVQSLHAVEAERQETVSRNAANCQVIELQQAEHRKTTDELKLAREEIETLKRAISQPNEENSSSPNQGLEALQIAADAERRQNANLQERLREAQLSVEWHTARLREVESALKVTTAELVEAQTVRPNGSEYSASPAPRSGLRSSRWPVADIADQTDNERRQQNGNLGCDIEGNVAGFIQRIKQLGDLNNDLVSEQTLIVGKLATIGQSNASNPMSRSSPSARNRNIHTPEPSQSDSDLEGSETTVSPSP